MSGGKHGGALLRGGEFYSPIKARLTTEEILFSELSPAHACRFPRHKHELPYVSVILAGDYREGEGGNMQDLFPFTTVFNPAGVEHATEIGPAGALAFTMELRHEHLQRLEMQLPPQTVCDRGGGALLWPALRLYTAFKTNAADPLVHESHVMELLAAIAGFRAFERFKPKWLVRVKERMHEELGSRIRMRDLADNARIHPVHLARVFREQEGRTPVDYLQQLRIRAACGYLRKPDYPLAIIAAECGFADQSHFTRVFRKFTGNTPALFRRALVRHCTSD